MTDNTGAEAALDVNGHDNVLEAPEESERTSTNFDAAAVAAASSDGLSSSQDAGHNVKPVTPALPLAPVGTGKRAIVNDAEEAQEHSLEDDSPPRKKARKGSSVKSTSSENSASSRNSASQPAAPGIAVSGLRTSFAQSAAPGLGGVRTSFGTSSQKQTTKDNIDFVMHTPLTNEERTQLIAAARDHESKDLPPLHKRRLHWVIGPIRSEFLVGSTWLEIWESAIDKWCEAFLADNHANVAQVGLTPTLLKLGFNRRLADEVGEAFPSTFQKINKILLKHPEKSRMQNFATGFKPDLEKEAKKQARNAAKSASAESDAVETSPTNERQSKEPVKGASTPVRAEDALANTYEEGEQENGSASNNQQTEDEMEDGEINSGDASGVDTALDEDAPPISQTELDERHHYFPNIPDNETFCLTCAQVGHATEACPDLTCKFCQGAHFKYECPTRLRCAKCKQLGHIKSSCPEKLAVAPGEVALECAVCEGHDHTEINCIQLYQIYRPEPGNVSKVRSLPVFCYACGTEGHYGGDCPMADRSIPPTKLWTMSTAALYIDPTSDKVALSYRNGLPPPREVTKPVIPGRSIKPQTHVIFEESDGEGDGDFIPLDNGGPAGRNKRNKKTNNGPAIQIASNISFGGNTGNSRSFGQQPQQPQQPQQQQQPKKKKGPTQPPNKINHPSNDAAKPSRRRNKGPPPSNSQPNFNSARNSQPPPRQNQGSGGRGGGNAGRGGGGFSQLASKRGRRGRR